MAKHDTQHLGIITYIVTSKHEEGNPHRCYDGAGWTNERRWLKMATHKPHSAGLKSTRQSDNGPKAEKDG